MESIIKILISKLEVIKVQYNVNPYIFGAIYVITIPPWGYGIVKIVDGLRKKQMNAVITWVIVVGISIIVPYLYIAVFGKNLPVWFWFILGIIVILSIYGFIIKIRKHAVKVRIQEKSS